MQAERNGKHWDAVWKDFVAAHRNHAARAATTRSDQPGTAHALVCAGSLPAALRPALMPPPMSLVAALVPDLRVAVTINGPPTVADRCAWWRDQQVIDLPAANGSAAEVILGLGSILINDPSAVVVIVPWSLRVDDPEPLYESLATAYLTAAQAASPIITLHDAQGETGAVIARGRALLARSYRRAPGLVQLMAFAFGLPEDEREQFVHESLPAAPELDFWTDIIAGSPGPVGLPLPARAGWRKADERDGANVWPTAATRDAGLAMLN